MEHHEQGGMPGDDPDFAPAPPKEPHFDLTRGTWILSRYIDVVAALREKGLHLASPKGETFPDGEDDAKRTRQFAQVRAEIILMSAATWRSEARSLAHRVICEAMSKDRIDLLGDITLPWCISILQALSGATQPDAERISELATCLHYKQSSKHCDPEKQLDRMLERKELALSKPMFLAVAQTLPSFLVKSWLALLRNPEEVLRL